ncbi:MAG: AI-2E family transporter [Synechococcales cyanobacterium C42_A2020_086]|jgi:predicted PurR-regulated permease PerM|nr:AI-2E family transporter [Synechococcales cyanobacterium C42_A2020_086]
MNWMNRFPWWINLSLAIILLALDIWIIFQLFQFFHSVIAIVIIATLLSFILEYPVYWLQRFRVPRLPAILLTLTVALLLLIVLGITLIPALIEQVDQLAKQLPTWIQSGTQQLTLLQSWAQSRNLPVDLGKLMTQLEDRLSNQLQVLSGSVLAVLLDIVGRLLDLLITIVLTFYLLLHGDRLWDGIFQWFPTTLQIQIRQALKQNFHNYFVGQSTLALLMGSAMTISFLVLQVPFGLLFGLVIGVMALFPFGASLSIVTVSLLLALQNIWLGIKVLVVAFLVDLVVENAIAPQLIGKFTGLNPAWILVSLLIGAKIGGLLGMILAVPIASFIKSMLEYFHRGNALTQRKINPDIID